MKYFQIIIGGAAGEGSKKAGLVLARFFSVYGFNVFIHEDYESLVKGGHNFSQISASEKKVDAVRKKVDFVLALNEDAIIKHKDKIKEDGGVLIYDSECTEEDFTGQGFEVVKAPLVDFVNEGGGITLMKNTALVSVFSKIVGMDWEKVKEVLQEEFKIKTEKNIEVAEVAFQKTDTIREINKTIEREISLISGNEAVAMGALDAGLDCYFAYPMTPATGILRFFSNSEKVKSYQPESEISSASMVLGAAYAGKRSMTGTSGGGFALMTESVSFSAQAEVPFVVALSQRMGPASGVPTYQAQGDLLFALNSGHGDMMRFVVTPGDADEAYELSGKAVNIAWKYQLPAVILLDKEISENTYTFKKEDQVVKEEVPVGDNSVDYNRYDGEDISPMSFPGGDAVVKVTGYEHDEKGVAVEDSESINKMHEKRIRKYEKLKEEVSEMPAIKCTGEGSTAVIFWGSTKGAVLEGAKNLNLKTVQILIMQPFPYKQLREALQGVERVVCVENNATGQLSKVLRSYGVRADSEILKYDGRPFSVEEVKEELEDL